MICSSPSRKPDSRGLKCEVEERILYRCSVHTALNEKQVREVVRYLKEPKVQTIAVCTLFSFINPSH
jgi:N-methylhydantoinase A